MFQLIEPRFPGSIVGKHLGNHESEDVTVTTEGVKTTVCGKHDGRHESEELTIEYEGDKTRIWGCQPCLRRGLCVGFARPKPPPRSKGGRSSRSTFGGAATPSCPAGGARLRDRRYRATADSPATHAAVDPEPQSLTSAPPGRAESRRRAGGASRQSQLL